VEEYATPYLIPPWNVNIRVSHLLVFSDTAASTTASIHPAITNALPYFFVLCKDTNILIKQEEKKRFFFESVKIIFN
jgi:hypothetical protein